MSSGEREEEQRAEGRDPPARVLSELMDRMAHELKNPLQAVGMNMEAVRLRTRQEAPETWEAVRAFAEAVDQNVRRLDRRLRLLLALGRRSPDDPQETVALERMVSDLLGAVRFDEEAPVVRLQTEDGGLAGRARVGYLIELIYRLLRMARAAATGAEVVVSVRSLEGRPSMELRVEEGTVGEGGGVGGEVGSEWSSIRRLADEAGGDLSAEPAEGSLRVRLILPSA